MLIPARIPMSIERERRRPPSKLAPAAKARSSCFPSSSHTYPLVSNWAVWTNLRSKTARGFPCGLWHDSEESDWV
jgi:hypothetical protein